MDEIGFQKLVVKIIKIVREFVKNVRESGQNYCPLIYGFSTVASDPGVTDRYRFLKYFRACVLRKFKLGKL